MDSIFDDAKAFDQDVDSWPNWEGKDEGEMSSDTDSASEDEEDSEEDISSEEEGYIQLEKMRVHLINLMVINARDL